MRRVAVLLGLLVLWSAFGFGVNRFLESRRSNLATGRAVQAPTAITPAFTLPGTVYVVQGGRLYRLHSGHFTALAAPPAAGSWMMPAAGPGGHLLAVARGADWSDVDELDATSGAVTAQLTNNASKNGHVELNAWSFWPHLAAGGDTVTFAYDGPKTGTSYEVDFAVWSGPVGGRLESTRWTTPNGYTGGDASPAPLPSGGVVYSKYMLTPDEKLVSRLAVVTRPEGPITYLTNPADDCSSPAVSPDGSHIAAICTSDTQSARLVVMSYANGVAGAPVVLVDGCQCASPAWSPDGTGLLYLAPPDPARHFQLWWVDRAAGANPAKPRSLSTDLDLDATSAPAWIAG